MPDGAYACPAETAKAAEQLRNLADMVPAARDIAHGLSRRGGGGASGKPGSRLPLDLMATAKLDAVGNELGGWVRHIVEQRGVYPARVPPGLDVLVPAARFLSEHLEWMRHRPEVDEFLTDIDACARIVAGIARGPSEQRFLGPCGALASEIDKIIDTYGEDPAVGLIARRCEGDVYAREGAQHGRCRICGAEWSTAERRAWLDVEVRQRAFCRTDIEDAYGIKANTVTTWWLRGKLKAYWITDAGLHAEWVELKPDPALKGSALARRKAEIEAEHKARGTKVFYLADVLELAAGDAARREEARATRARRAAVKAEEASDAA